MIHILSNYPLSAAYSSEIEKIYSSDLEYLEMTKLRRASIPEMFGYLRRLKSEAVIIAMEDSSGIGVLPILKMLAYSTKAKRLEVLNHNLERKVFSRFSALAVMFNFLFITLRIFFARKQCQGELEKLINEPRQEMKLGNSLKCLYLNANLWFGVKAGGSVGHISGVANGLMDMNYGLDFVSVGGHLLVDERATFFDLIPPKSFGVPFEQNYYYFHQNVVHQVSRYLEKRDCDFIYQRLSLANYSGVVLSRQYSIPLIIEYNGSEAWIAKNWGQQLRYHNLAVLAEDVVLKHAHLVVTISEPLKEELIDRGVDEKRIVMYPNCINPGMFNPENFSKKEISALRLKHGISDDACVLTFIGTFGQWHGVDVLAKVIRLLCEDHMKWLKENKIHFLVVGDGLRMPEIREILSADICKPYFTLTGLVPQKEAPMYLAASDILLSPHVPNDDGSKFFGSPTKLFEYMAMGKGIIASDLDQIGEILGDCIRVSDAENQGIVSQVAMLTKPGDIDELVEAIKLLVEKPAVRNAIGKNARNLALEKYTWKHHVKAILNGAKKVL